MEQAEDAVQAQEPPTEMEQALETTQHQYTSPQGVAAPGVQQLQLYLKLVVQQQDLQPGICRRGQRPPQTVARIVDWGTVKKTKSINGSKKEPGQQRERENPRSRWAQQRAGVHKIAGTAGRTFTSRFRGVHQTFPTKRWEAQFRRNGKPTSLGCFDKEDEAARAYDRMMLWCEIHGAGGNMKGSVTNFDLTEYEKDIAWLTGITQDDLIESLRSEGRRQAMNRQAAALNAKRTADLTRDGRSRSGMSDDGGGEATAEGADTTAGPPADGMDCDQHTSAAAAGSGHEGSAGDGGDAADVSMAAADGAAAAGAVGGPVLDAMFDPAAASQLLQDAQAAAAAAAAAGHALLDQGMPDLDPQQAAPGMLSIPAASPGGNELASPAAAAAAAAFLASPAGASPAAMNLLFGSIGQEALAAVQQLQQQLDLAAASGAEPDADAAAAAAFQIGQIAGSNLLAALSAGPSPAGAAVTAGAGVTLPFGMGAGNDALAAYGLDDAAAAALAAVGGEDMTVGLQGVEDS